MRLLYSLQYFKLLISFLIISLLLWFLFSNFPSLLSKALPYLGSSFKLSSRKGLQKAEAANKLSLSMLLCLLTCFFQVFFIRRIYWYIIGARIKCLLWPTGIGLQSIPVAVTDLSNVVFHIVTVLTFLATATGIFNFSLWSDFSSCIALDFRKSKC